MTKLETLATNAKNLIADLFGDAYIAVGMDAAEYLRKVVIDSWEYDPDILAELGFDDILYDALHWDDEEH